MPLLVGQFPIPDLSFLRPKDERGKRERRQREGREERGREGEGWGGGP